MTTTSAIRARRSGPGSRLRAKWLTIGGSANINNIQLLAGAASISAVGQFNSFDTPAMTITSGDFVVGFSTTEDHANPAPSNADCH